MRSAKIEEPQADKIKDFKRFLRAKEGLSVTEAEILSQAVELALLHYDELVERLKPTEGRGRSVVQYILENPAKGKKETDAAKDHDMVPP